MNIADPFIRALTGDEGEQTVTLVRSYPAAAEEVWNALTTPERIARWYGTIVGTPPRAVGDEFEVEIGEGMVRRAVLESCAAPSGLSYTWWSGDGDPGLVTIRLDAIADDETRLTVQHDRLRPHRMTQYGGGWEQNLVALAGVLGGSRAEAEEDGDARVGRWELLGGRPARCPARDRGTGARGCGRHGPAPRGCRPGGGRTGTTSPIGGRRAGRRRVPDRGARARDRGLGGVPRRRARAPARLHVDLDGRRRPSPATKRSTCRSPQRTPAAPSSGAPHRSVGRRRARPTRTGRGGSSCWPSSRDSRALSAAQPRRAMAGELDLMRL